MNGTDGCFCQPYINWTVRVHMEEAAVNVAVHLKFAKEHLENSQHYWGNVLKNWVTQKEYYVGKYNQNQSILRMTCGGGSIMIQACFIASETAPAGKKGLTKATFSFALLAVQQK